MDRELSDLNKVLLDSARAGTLREGLAYSRSDLVGILRPIAGESAMDLFNSIRTVANSGIPVGEIRISFFGNKRGRRYTFGNLGTTAYAPPPNEYPSSDNESEDASANDHPEDRAHLAAHVALLLKRRCIAVSMPKVAGRRRGSSPSHNENPDMVGVVVGRRTAMPSIRTDVPSWLALNTRRELAVTIGAEVKPVTTTGNDLYWAVVEARHNSRYFDEAWLISQIPSDLHADARDLGEEYNVGILSCQTRMQSDVLWSPLRRTSTRNIGDFFSRFGSQEAETRINELRKCHELAAELPHTLRRAALEQLVSNQVSTSLVRRLPASMQESLRSPTGAPQAASDLEVYCDAVIDLFLDAYEYDAAEEATIEGFWRALGIREALSKLGDMVSPKASAKVRELLETAVTETASDREAVKRAFSDG